MKTLFFQARRFLVGLGAASIMMVVPGTLPAAETETPKEVSWGTINSADVNGILVLSVRNWPDNGMLQLPQSVTGISAVRLRNGGKWESLRWTYHKDRSGPHIDIPLKAPVILPATIEVEIATKTQQFPDGHIVFSPADATMDAALMTWDFKPTRWGMYEIELTDSAVESAGRELLVGVAGKAFVVNRPPTMGWPHRTLNAGHFYLEKAQPFSVKVGSGPGKDASVASLKAITLRPAPEGPVGTQLADGTLTLSASNAIVHGVMMRYEPAINKNCLGYWTNPNDWAEWEFEVTKPGTYEVEVSHGAGKNQGGDILVEVNGERFPFATVDTGDIHKHTGLKVGTVTFKTPGGYSLAVKPQKKYGGAIMDIDAVRLLPVAKP